MELAHRLWGDPAYARERDVFVEMLAASVYPMGAWPYINTQNECFVYHHHPLSGVGRFAEPGKACIYFGVAKANTKDQSTAREMI